MPTYPCSPTIKNIKTWILLTQMDQSTPRAVRSPSPSFPRSAWECRLRRSASCPERNGRLTGDTIDVVTGVLAHPAERGNTGSHAERGNQGDVVASGEKCQKQHEISDRFYEKFHAKITPRKRMIETDLMTGSHEPWESTQDLSRINTLFWRLLGLQGLGLGSGKGPLISWRSGPARTAPRGPNAPATDTFSVRQLPPVG